MGSWPVAPSFGNVSTHLVSCSLPKILDIVNSALRRMWSQPIPATSEQASIFLELPLEMRVSIYEAAILDDGDGDVDSDENAFTSSSINLLHTCRQVKMEAEPIRYRRPQSFSSQAKFLIWIDNSHDSNLAQVHTLTLHLTDVDLSMLLNPVTVSPGRGSTAWSIYKTELGELEEAFRSLGKLSSLTIIPPKDNGSKLLELFYQSFLAMLSTCRPELKRLELHDSADVLEHVPTLKNIAEMIFTQPILERQMSTGQSSARRFSTSPSPVMKVERDAAESRTIVPPYSLRSMRRSRATRVVSD